MPAAARIDALIAHVTGAVAAVLKLDAGRSIDAREGFFDLGMDSLMAVELKTRLECLFGAPLPSTLTFNYPNIEALAGFLDVELFAGREAPAAETEAAPSARASAGAAVADAVPAAAMPAAAAAAAVPADDESEDALEEQLAEKLSKLGL
jgi:acyl carrier protein